MLHIKKLISIILFLFFSLLKGQSVDSVHIQYEDMRCYEQNDKEWVCDIYSYLYKNGQMVEHQENYTYTWYIKQKDETEFTKAIKRSGTGLIYSHRDEDGMFYQHFDNYVTVEGPDFFVTSNIIDVGFDGSNQSVTLMAKRQNGEILSLNQYFKEYTNPRWFFHPSNQSRLFFLNQYRILWTNTDIISGINEKYFKWIKNSEPYINYNNFFISNTTTKIEVITHPVCSVTLQANVLSGGNGIKIGFKDPWFADGPELSGIKKNLGKDAIWYDYEHLEITLDNSDPYKGVFKDLTENEPLYYSIRASKTKTLTVHNNVQVDFFFTNWQTNSQATITQPDHTETIDNVVYYTSPVIFHGDNAQVTAEFKGHLASSIARATGYNNGRRLRKTNDGKLHLVYEDDNTIW